MVLDRRHHNLLSKSKFQNSFTIYIYIYIYIFEIMFGTVVYEDIVHQLQHEI